MLGNKKEMILISLWTDGRNKLIEDQITNYQVNIHEKSVFNR